VWHLNHTFPLDILGPPPPTPLFPFLNFPAFPPPPSLFPLLLVFISSPSPLFPLYFHFLPPYFHPQNFNSLLLLQNLFLIHYSLSLFLFHYYFLSHTLTLSLSHYYHHSPPLPPEPPPPPPPAALQHHRRPCHTLSLSLLLSYLFISLSFLSL
jgi:hypothetical protein